jgi:hypothetical protein
MKNPKYVEVNNKKYKINTSYKVALECNKIISDESIGDFERFLAMIYKLFGEEALNNPDEYEKLLELAEKYLLCNQEREETTEVDMDYEEDWAYIKASFRSDYNINLDEEDIEWWDFNALMNGLSNSDMGNCCVLNRIRNLRNYDTSQIKDQKEKTKIEKAKEQVALKKQKAKRELTNEQQNNINAFYETLK